MLTHTPAFVVELERLLPARRQEPMSRHTTFQIGGPADYYAQAQTVAQLRSVGALAHREGVPLFIIGAGSNLLVSDAGIAGLVVETWSNDDPLAQHPPQTDPDNPAQRIMRVYSGVPLPRLALRAAAAGLTGLEWAVGIPGTVGGGVVNNAGAHGSQIADIVRSVLVLDAQGERWVPQEELGYGYRSSNFRTQWVAGAPRRWCWPPSLPSLKLRPPPFNSGFKNIPPTVRPPSPASAVSAPSSKTRRTRPRDGIWTRRA